MYLELKRSIKFCWLIFAIAAGKWPPDTCPSESLVKDKPHGFRLRHDKCVTLMTLDKDDFVKKTSSTGEVEKLLPYLNDVTCRQLRGGSLYSTEPFFRNIHSGWYENIHVDYILYGYAVMRVKLETEVFPASFNPRHYFYVNLIMYDENGQRRIQPVTIIVIRHFWTKNVQPHWTEYRPNEYYPHFDHLSSSSVDFYHSRLHSPHAIYPTYWIDHGTLKTWDGWPTSREIMGYSKVHLTCQSAPYRDCIQFTQSGCFFYGAKNEWYSKRMVVRQYDDKPYGEPCQNVTPDQIYDSKICNKTCVGKWSNWTAVIENPKGIKCGTYTEWRYRPANIGDAPCYNESAMCCGEQRTLVAPYLCSDYNTNFDINLKMEGCKHNRTLKVGIDGHLECDCGPWYGGIQCEIDLCKDKCLNGGSCVGFGNGSVCLCKLGYEGDQCEKLKEKCGVSGVCENGGKCVETSKDVGAYCECPPGYGGLSCETVTEYCTESTCNNNGLCLNDTERHSFLCTCYEGFSGLKCQHFEGYVPLIFDESNILPVLAIVLLVAALILFCTGGAVVHRRRRRRRAHGRSRSATDTSYSSVFSTIGSKMGFSTVAKTTKAKQKTANPTSATASQAVGISTVGKTEKK